jgi:hypothetical protein
MQASKAWGLPRRNEFTALIGCIHASIPLKSMALDERLLMHGI